MENVQCSSPIIFHIINTVRHQYKKCIGTLVAQSYITNFKFKRLYCLYYLKCNEIDAFRCGSL